MHRLVRGYLGVNYILHAYDENETSGFNASWDELAPKFQYKTLDECLSIMSNHLSQIEDNKRYER